MEIDMKNDIKFLSRRFFTVVFVVFFLSLGSAIAKPELPPEMQAWLKKAELGAYEPSKENWDEIVKKAIEEMTVENAHFPLEYFWGFLIRFLVPVLILVILWYSVTNSFFA